MRFIAKPKNNGHFFFTPMYTTCVPTTRIIAVSSDILRMSVCSCRCVLSTDGYAVRPVCHRRNFKDLPPFRSEARKMSYLFTRAAREGKWPRKSFSCASFFLVGKNQTRARQRSITAVLYILAEPFRFPNTRPNAAYRKLNERSHQLQTLLHTVYH